jgi:hypothetical protein
MSRQSGTPARRTAQGTARRIALRGGAVLWAVFTLVAVVAGLAAASSVGGAINGAASRPRTAAQVHAALDSPGLGVGGGTVASPTTPASTRPPHGATHPGRPPAAHHSRPGSAGQPPAGVGGTTASAQPSGSPSSPPAGPRQTPGSTAGGGNNGGSNNGGGQGQSAAQRATLSSSGGTVVASCRNSQATLLTWSPAIGYRVNDVTAGPTSQAFIQFESDNHHDVTMLITCGSDGAPRASVHGDDHADE